MTEVICPFCGTPNPPEADVCSSCKKSLYELPEGNQPNWLKNLRDFTANDDDWQENNPKEGQKGKPATPSEEEIPEWLVRIRQRSLEEREMENLEGETESGSGESADTPPSGKEPFTEWPPNPEGAAESGSTPPEIPIEEWLGADRASETKAPETPGEDVPPQDWLDFTKEVGPEDTKLAGQTPQPSDEAVKSEEPETAPPEEIRGWLEQLLPDEQNDEIDFSAFDAANAEQAEGEAEQPAEPDFAAAPEFLENLNEPTFKTEFPDWADEGKPGTDAEEDLQQPSTRPADITPEARIELIEALGEGSKAAKDDALPQDPERPVTPDEGTKASQTGAEPDIEPAQLPGWLEAIRPVESVAPLRFSSEIENRVESSGPLAGFQGVIPGGAAASAYSRPAAYTVKLHVSDKQRIYANLLENLVAEEGKPVSKPAEKVAASPAALRLFVAILLIGVTAFMLVSGFQFNILPSLYAPETVAFFDAVQQLQPVESATSQILVAVDFEPGLAGEMQTIALYPLQQLLENGTGLALISTMPGGPAIGEKLVADASALIPAFQYNQQVINLGYLAGGTASLASLAASPSTAVQFALDGQPAWSSPLLQSIQSLEDFNGLLLITDNPETARFWVEQVQPSLVGKPLLVISSAQSSPMIQPYYQSGQVQGLLAGLSGSASYEQLAQREASPTRRYWDAFQSGILLIILAILIGAIVYSIQAAIRSRQPAKRI